MIRHQVGPTFFSALNADMVFIFVVKTLICTILVLQKNANNGWRVQTVERR